MKFLSTTKVRQNLQDVIDSVHYRKDTVVITKTGRPWAVISPIPENDDSFDKAITDFAETLNATKN